MCFDHCSVLSEFPTIGSVRRLSITVRLATRAIRKEANVTRRDMALQATLVFTLICGIVGGNFVLHRWIIGDAASREAGASARSESSSQEDLDEFAPASLVTSNSAVTRDPVAHREQLRKLIAEKLPQAPHEVREAWLEELSELSLPAAAGVLDLRGQVGAFPQIDADPKRQPSDANLPDFDFSIRLSR